MTNDAVLTDAEFHAQYDRWELAHTLGELRGDIAAHGEELRLLHDEGAWRGDRTGLISVQLLTQRQALEQRLHALRWRSERAVTH